jgi:hypothetical protein
MNVLAVSEPHLVSSRAAAGRGCYQAHLRTEQFRKFRAATADMVKSRRLIDMIPLSLATKAK